MSRICILRHSYFPDDPRDRKQAYALVEAGHEVDVICLRRSGQAAAETVERVAVRRIPLEHRRAGVVRYFAEYAASFLMMSGLLLLRHLARHYRCIQVSTMPDFLAFATLFPKLLGAKVVIDLHEPTPELWTTKYGQRLPRLRQIQAWIEKQAIRYADHCITVTGMLRRRFGERGADTNKITVIPNVCEESFEVAAARPADSHSGTASVPPGKFVLVTHGLIEERYGHALVIRALDHLRDEYPNIAYLIMGDGEYAADLKVLVAELDLGERVHFTGFLSSEDLLCNLQSADVGVIAMLRSPYSELIDTNKMYEFMALRKPVIVSRLPAIEAGFDDTCLIYFTAGDSADLARAVTALYRDPRLRDRLAENAFQRYRTMRWGDTKHTYVKIIESVIGMS